MKLTFLLFLGRILDLPNTTLNETLEPLLKNTHYSEGLIEFSLQLLERLNYRGGVNTLNILIEFEKKIKGRSIDKFSTDETAFLVNQLQKNMQYVGNNFTCNEIGKIVTSIKELHLEISKIKEVEESGFGCISEIYSFIKNYVPRNNLNVSRGSGKETGIELKATEIIFGPKQVRFSTKEEPHSRNNQPMKLLEYFILKGQLHYLYGYIIFKEWRHRTFEDPKREWNDIKSKLVGPKEGIFAQYNLTLKIEPTFSDPDIYELIGSYVSNLNYLKEIFGQDPKIDNFSEGLKELSPKDVKDLKDFLIQKLNDYDNGIRIISNQKSIIKNWNDSAANAFKRIKSEKEVLINILQKCFSIAVPEQSEISKIEVFEMCKSFIEFIKKFDIDGLGEDQLKKEISEDDIYYHIWNDILKKLYESIGVETKTEDRMIIRIMINVIRETELEWQRFETEEGLIYYLCAKIKKRLRQNRNPVDKDQVKYERYSNDFKNAEQELLSKPDQVLTNESIAKKLINDYHWTAKRYWDFLALKEFMEKQKPYDDESDKEKGKDDDTSDENH